MPAFNPHEEGFLRALNELVEAARQLPSPEAGWVEGVLTGVVLERHFPASAQEFVHGLPTLLQRGTALPAESWESLQIEIAARIDELIQRYLMRTGVARKGG